MSYRELNESANQLARYLLKRGVGPGITIGLSINRGDADGDCFTRHSQGGGTYVPPRFEAAL